MDSSPYLKRSQNGTGRGSITVNPRWHSRNTTLFTAPLVQKLLLWNR
jgi:hypothetical protein